MLNSALAFVVKGSIKANFLIKKKAALDLKLSWKRNNENRFKMRYVSFTRFVKSLE